MTEWLQKVSVTFDGTPVMREFTLALPQTGVVALFGPSGCGKTTLLRLLAGLIEADKGAVNRPAAKPSVLFQEPRLMPWYTALDNVACVLPGPRAAARRQAAEWLSRVGLEQDAGKYPHELSGGMQCRVSLARALCYDGNPLLLDEPFSGLDAETKQSAIQLVKRYAIGRLCVVVTHDPREAFGLADRVLVLEGGPLCLKEVIDVPADGRDVERLIQQYASQLHLQP